MIFSSVFYYMSPPRRMNGFRRFSVKYMNYNSNISYHWNMRNHALKYRLRKHFSPTFRFYKNRKVSSNKVYGFLILNISLFSLFDSLCYREKYHEAYRGSKKTRTRV